MLFFLFLLVFSLKAEEKKIALMFLTRSDLNQTEMWKQWIDFDKFNVYNHSAECPTDPWFSQFGIGNRQPNAWCRVLLAERALLQSAIKDPSNYKFVLLSESCVPLKTAEQVYEILTECEESFLGWQEIWWEGVPERTLSEFPVEHHLGNHAWYILNRKHAELMAKDNYWVHFAHNKFAGCEAYQSTFLSMKGLLHECKQLRCTSQVGGWPVYVFDEASEDNVQWLLQAKRTPQVLFVRKVSPSFPCDVLLSIQNSD